MGETFLLMGGRTCEKLEWSKSTPTALTPMNNVESGEL